MSKNSNKSKNGTTTFSSRIYTEIFSVLEKEALSKNISINSLVNNILGKYVSLERHANDIELITLTKRAITSIFNGMDDKSINAIAIECGGVVHRELVFLKFDQMTFDNLMQVIVVNATRYGTVKHNSENSKHSICIHHGACIEFSIFLSRIHEIMAQHLSIKITITEKLNSCLKALKKMLNLSHMTMKIRQILSPKLALDY
jgi:hypothetical protein